MAKETITRCDVCGETDDVRTVIIRDGSTWEVDLCIKHRGPIEKLAGKGREMPGSGGRSRDTSKTLDAMVRGVPE